VPVRRQLGPIAVLVVAFAASRLGFWLAGVRFDMTPLTNGSEQLLGVRLLRDQLLSSVWHLNSQPPLFNLYCGLLLRLPHGLQEPVAWATFMAVGLVLVVATYLLLVELRVSTTLALVVGLLLVAGPSQILYENWLFYALPSAATVTLTVLFFARYARTRWWADGLACFVCVSGLALLDSTYQAAWVIGVCVLAVLVFRTRLRQLLVVAAVPVLVFAGWIVKDAVMFGTVTTSSWVGMNLSNVTLQPAARTGQLHVLVKEGKLNRLALVGAFKPVSAYSPRFVAEPHSGVAALDDNFGNTTWPNFNNLVYVHVSSSMLADDLHYIALEPRHYLHNVGIGATIWLTPADQYPFVYQNWLKIRPLVTVYDTVVGWQADRAPGQIIALRGIEGDAPSSGQISYSTVLIYVVALVGTPLVLWFRRRHLGRATVGTLVLLWGTIVYAYAASSLLDLSENNRFRFELGPAPLILAIVVGLTGVEPLVPVGRRDRWWWRWFGLTPLPATGPAATGPAATEPAVTEPVTDAATSAAH
jgi:hypothetical protein